MGRRGRHCRQCHRGGHLVHGARPEAELTQCAQGTAGSRAERGIETGRKPGPVGRLSYNLQLKLAVRWQPQRPLSRVKTKALHFQRVPTFFKIQGYGMGPGPRRRAVKQDPQDVQGLHVVTHAQLIDRSPWWHQTQGEQVTAAHSHD